MIIAVPFENGEIFQHFGKAENIKIYVVEEGAVASSEVIAVPTGEGHEAVASLLAEKEVDMVLCGGIGEGMIQALTEAGITGYSDLSGNADEIVNDFIASGMAEGNCGASCGGCGCGGEDGGCGCGGDGESGEGGCGGGGCGGCGGKRAPQFEGPNVGKTVKVHYKGTLNDGSQFDSSYDRGEPLEFVCGAGMMIQGFDKAVATMEVGQIVDIHLMPEEAYGEANPAAIFTLPIAELAGSENLEVGMKVVLRNSYGQPIPVKVIAKDETNITFDANHEMAGKELNFRIELVEVK